MPIAIELRGVVLGAADAESCRAGGLRLGRELYLARARAVLSSADIVAVVVCVGDVEGEEVYANADVEGREVVVTGVFGDVELMGVLDGKEDVVGEAVAEDTASI